jgi:hypothetical protein
MKKIIVFIMLLSAQTSFGQLINGGFELWDTAYTGLYSPSMTSLFGVPNPKSGTANHWISSSEWATDQTTDSHSGNYALILHNWYNYARGKITYIEPISYRPKYLQGYFKYITGGVNGRSHGRANITLTHFNGTSNDTVANGVFLFDSTMAYTPFQITLNYVSTVNPDSIKLYFINSDTNVFSDVVCHLLYLDDLALSDTPLGLEELTIDKDGIRIYPNPAVNELNICNNTSQLLEFSLYNVLGERLSKQLLGNTINHINLSDYATGIYFYELRSEKNIIKTGKVVKE